MANEMDGLAEGVRNALDALQLLVGVSGDDLPVVRAELLRLAQREKELERERDTVLRALYRWVPRIRDNESPEMKSASDDAALLLGAPNCDDEPEHGEAILLRAERAEAELAAIRKRIAEAPTGRTYWLEGRTGVGIACSMRHEDVGSLVALLPLDDEAKG